jgi:hypothetical protein
MTALDWTSVVQCPACKLVAEINAQDILWNGRMFIQCPKPECDVKWLIDPECVPKFVVAIVRAKENKTLS